MTDSPASSGPAPTPQAGRAAPPPGGVSADATPDSVFEKSTTPEPLDFARTLDTYEPKLMRYAARLLAGTAPAPPGPDAAPARDTQPADLVQEAFLRLHRHGRVHGSTSIRHPGTWLYRVVHNLAMDALRKRVRTRDARPALEAAARQRADDADEHDAAALGQLEQREQIDLAMRLLHDLPEQQRRVITLKLLDGLTLRQIAEVLGSSPGSVNYHLNQGLTRLAQQLKQRGAV